jgi:hypothetical protein
MRTSPGSAISLAVWRPENGDGRRTGKDRDDTGRSAVACPPRQRRAPAVRGSGSSCGRARLRHRTAKAFGTSGRSTHSSDHASRVNCLLNVPLGVLALVLAQRYLPADRGTESGAYRGHCPEQVLPNGVHGCFVDYQDNVWIAGNGDGIVQKYPHNGSTQPLLHRHARRMRQPARQHVRQFWSVLAGIAQRLNVR